MSKSVKDENKELVKMFFKLVNCKGNETDLAQEFFEEFSRQHRTLQQSGMRVFKEAIEKYADNSLDFSDARNEAGLKWAKAVKRMNEEGEHYLPFV